MDDFRFNSSLIMTMGLYAMEPCLWLEMVGEGDKVSD